MIFELVALFHGLVIFTELEWKGKRTGDELEALASAKLGTKLHPIERFDLSQGEHSNEMEHGDLRCQPSNILVHGDNLPVMRTLLEVKRECIDLIYVDPPFATGSNQKYQVLIGEGTRVNAEWDAYRDTWQDPAEYLTMIQERIWFMHRLLKPTGCMYVHVDEKMCHHVRLILDEIFGRDNFLNEIIWVYKRWTASARKFQKLHDVIFLYSKTGEYTFNTLHVPYEDDERHYTHEDEKGQFRWQHLDGRKYKLYKKKGVKMGDWWNIPYLNSMAKERTGYPTQKPETLLKHMIMASSNPGDVVADFFCGAGTTLAVAEKLDRCWIGCDSSPQSMLTCRKRLLGLTNSGSLEGNGIHGRNCHPFTLMNIAAMESHGSTTSTTSPKATPAIKKGKIDARVKPGTVDRPCKVLLAGFEPPDDDATASVKNEVTGWEEWIDGWMVDLDHDGAMFIPSWWSFRDRWHRDLELVASIPAVQVSNVKVKVFDILGRNSSLLIGNGLDSS